MKTAAGIGTKEGTPYLGDAHLLQGFTLSCYSCPSDSLPSSANDATVIPSARGQCHSSLWRMVDPSGGPFAPSNPDR